MPTVSIFCLSCHWGTSSLGRRREGGEEVEEEGGGGGGGGSLTWGGWYARLRSMVGHG